MNCPSVTVSCYELPFSDCVLLGTADRQSCRLYWGAA